MSPARIRSGVAVLIATLLGAALFTWPFYASGAPGGTAAAALALGTAGGLLVIELGSRRLDSRGLALLAALCALDAGARAVLVTGIGGFSPIFLLILCGGYVFGPGYGFLLGATSLVASALVTGGIGPWLPYQLFALGWVGAVAGLAGLRRRKRPGWVDVAVLAAVGVAAGYGFGAVMDIWNWTFYQNSPDLGFAPGMPPGLALGHFAHFYVVTSAVYDSFRAVGNAVLVGGLGLPILLALARLRARHTVEHVPLQALEEPAAQR
jgi:energy-coupling factor transport system substrate-specific component